MTTTLIIADDHPMLAEGVSRILEELDGVKVIAIVSNGRQLQDRLFQSPVDMLLLDLNMPGLDGLSLLPVLKKDYPKLKILVYTSYDEPGLVRKVKQLGANGYILKIRGASIIKDAIMKVINGFAWFDEKDRSSQATPHYFSNEFTARHQITKREAEIIRLILKGKTTKEISEILFVSEFTINAHRRNISRKLNVNTVAGLMRFARENGFL